MANILQFMPELTGFEMQYVQNLTESFDEKKMLNYANLYRARRKDPQLILLTTLLGFIFVAGIHRILLGQIGMGILYIFTGGLCLIGTIVDLINYQDLAFRYNQQIANECKMQIESFK